MVNKIDRRGKKTRLIFVVSEYDLCIIKLDKNKDKNTKKTNPFAYTVFRRVPYQNFQSITFSTMADNYFNIKVLNEPDSFLENRKKTEIIAAVKKVSPNTQIQFSDTITIELKKKKKTQFSFQLQQDSPEGGLLKGKKIMVPPGLGKDAYPDIHEPVKVEHTRTYVVSGYENNNTRKMDIPPQNTGRTPPPRGGRLPPRNVPPPEENDDNGDDGQEDYNPPPRRMPPPGRLPPRNQPQDNDEDNEVDSTPPPRRMPGGRGLPLPRRTPPPM